MGREFDFGYAEVLFPRGQFEVPRSIKQAVKSEILWATVDFGAEYCILSIVHCHLYREAGVRVNNV